MPQRPQPKPQQDRQFKMLLADIDIAATHFYGQCRNAAQRQTLIEILKKTYHEFTKDVIKDDTKSCPGNRMPCPDGSCPDSMGNCSDNFRNM